MHQPCWDSNVLGESPCPREAKLVVTSFTQVGQTHPAIATGAAEQEALRYHLVSWREMADLHTDCNNLTSPFMTRNNWLAIEVCWPGALVEFHIAAGDTDHMDADEHVL